MNKHNKNCIHGKLQEHSLEAQTVLSELEASMPTLDDLMSQVDKFVLSQSKFQSEPQIIDVIIPMLCSYLPYWWSQGPDNVNVTQQQQQQNYITMVTTQHLNVLLKSTLNLIKNHIGTESAPWMVTIAGHAGQIIINSSEELLLDPLLPLAEKVKVRTESIYHREELMRGYLKSLSDDQSSIETDLQSDYSLLSRDIYSFYPLLIKYVDIQKNHWLKNNVKEAEQLYNYVATIFNIWSKSQYFKREEQNFVSQNEIDNMALIMPSSGRGGRISANTSGKKFVIL